MLKRGDKMALGKLVECWKMGIGIGNRMRYHTIPDLYCNEKLVSAVEKFKNLTIVEDFGIPMTRDAVRMTYAKYDEEYVLECKKHRQELLSRSLIRPKQKTRFMSETQLVELRMRTPPGHLNEIISMLLKDSIEELPDDNYEHQCKLDPLTPLRRNSPLIYSRRLPILVYDSALHGTDSGGGYIWANLF
ncbi:hypothetical protein ACH5RR_036781 [Cinchona calisaya]|uniref:39S ribosomal protein L17, mitochondrial n=2 Tax=Cinchona calisaya TaxID=153742 RepID=A0ABD2Y465_9GENT